MYQVTICIVFLFLMRDNRFTERILPESGLNNGKEKLILNKVIRTPDYPVVQTPKGGLHGFQLNDVFHFHGIQYASAQRFRPATPTPSWDGVKQAKSYGYICPLLPEDPHPEGDENGSPENSFEMPHRYWPMSENCLYLNVWSKHINEDARRPVMVWLHGGGFGAGSSIEQPAYDGHNLCDYGDVVVVSLNHRLNCIGFMNLSDYGEQYRYTGCLGMMDIVLALEWVRDNISSFGGDPDNVTVFGQSGGGGKVQMLLQMPIADGLFHKGIIESGSLTASGSVSEEAGIEESKRITDRVVELLGLTRETIGQIDILPYDQIAAASQQAAKDLGIPDGMMLFKPVPVEGVYTGSWRFQGFREESRHIPMINGTVLGEFSFMHFLGDKNQYTEEQKLQMIRDQFQEDADTVLEEFRKVYPDKDILYALSVDALFRPPARSFVQARAEWAGAPVYSYMFCPIIPYMGGVAPWHCAEIPYVFRNVDMEPAMCCAYQYTERLQEEISRAWVTFARTGNPSTDVLHWEPYTSENPQLMMFDEDRSGMAPEKDALLLELVRKHTQFF